MTGAAAFKNQAIKLYRLLGRRKYRLKHGLIVLEGYHLVNEAYRAGIKIKTVLYTDDFLKLARNRLLLEQLEKANRIPVEGQVFQALSQTENPQGLGAIAVAPELQQNIRLEQESFCLVLDAIQDPGNLGTIIRTAAAANVDGLVLLPGTVDPFNPKALRASMGGVFYLPLVHDQDYSAWKEIRRAHRLQVVAADPEGACLFSQVNFQIPTALIIGNENKGISRPLLESVDIFAKIPLQGKIASLNAAVAAAVFIFEKVRQGSF